MSVPTRARGALVVFAFLFALGLTPASAQTTGTITGRALDSSGGLVPGVEVSITSPQMIGGARSVVTDEQGVYRFTLLPPGTYRVSFKLMGFQTLNVDGVNVDAGATMTINGTLQLDSLSEEVTVTSEAPTIDLAGATVGINWDEKQMETLPYGRGVRGLARLVPGLSPTQFDVGGNTVGGSTTTGARSYGRSGQELIAFDGVVWDQFFGDYNTYDQIQVAAAAKGAELQSPGVTLNFVVRSGSNTFHGTQLVSWQDGAFQSDNVDQDLLNQGYVPGDNKFTRYNDLSFDLGGPLLRDKLWFYAAYGHNYSGLLIPGFISTKTGEQVEFFTRLDNPTLKLTYQATQNNKFEFTQQLNRKWQPYRNASAFVPLEASQNQLAWTAIGPAVKWNYIIGQSMTLDMGLNRSGYWWPDKAWTDDVRITDLTTTHTRGAFLELNREPARYGYNGALSWFRDFKGMNHEIKTGFIGYRSTNRVENYGYPNQQIYRYRSLPGDTNFFQRPDSVQVFDYPNTTDSGVYYNALYVNDQIQITRKLTVNAGLRFDRYASWLPEQGNPGTGPFAVAAVIQENHNFPTYNRFSPRLSAIYDISGNGRIALKASYGRYGAAGSGPNAASGPVANAVNPAETRVATYSNWDGRIPYVPVAANLISQTGGGRDRRIDSNAVGEYMDEYTVGVDLGLSRNVTARVNYVHKHDYRNLKTLDLAAPFEAFTDVRTGVDPGRDNVVGTADDGVVRVWSVPRTWPDFGKVITLATNAAPGEGEDTYHAFEFVLNKRFSDRWSGLAAYTIDRRNVRNATPQNPNEAAYNWELPETYAGLRFNGTFEGPLGINIASTYTAQQGEYYNRVVQVRNALNSTVNVVVEGQAGRYDWVKLMDLRLSKTFGFGRHSIEGMFDVFNLTNSNVILRRVTTNGPNFMKPLATSGIDAASALPTPAPRIFRLSLRYKF